MPSPRRNDRRTNSDEFKASDLPMLLLPVALICFLRNPPHVLKLLLITLASSMSLALVVLVLLCLLVAAIIYGSHWLDGVSQRDAQQRYTSSRRIPSLRLARAANSIRTSSAQGTPSLSHLGSLGDAWYRLFAAVIRDFIRTWHGPIAGDGLGSDDFVQLVQERLHGAAVELTARLDGVDGASVLMTKALPRVTAHLEALRFQDMALQGYPDIDYDDENHQEIALFLANRYSRFQRLHPAVGSLSVSDTRPTELAHLRKLSARILDALLTPQEANLPLLRIILTDILACTVLLPLVERISDPDFWCELLDSKATMLLEEHRQGGNLQTTVDQKSKGRDTSPNVAAVFPRGSSAANLERYLEQLRTMESLVEARRVRHSLVQRLEKVRLSGAGQQSASAKPKAEMLAKAVRTVDARIAQLSRSQHSSGSARAASSPPAQPRENEISLMQVLNNPIALSYFSDHLESRGRRPLMQFYIAVESWKEPLEVPGVAASTPLAREDAIRFARMLDHTLFGLFAARHSQVLRAFIEDEGASEMDARKAILEAQDAVLKEMKEEDWPPFQRSTHHRYAATVVARQVKRGQDVVPFTTVAPQPRSSARARRTSEQVPEMAYTRKVTHADLFGESSDEEKDSASLAKHGPKRPGNLHYQHLMGGKSGTLSKLDGRSPLFSDPLFEEDEQDVEPLPLSSEGTRSSTKDEYYIREETMEALEEAVGKVVPSSSSPLAASSPSPRYQSESNSPAPLDRIRGASATPPPSQLTRSPHSSGIYGASPASLVLTPGEVKSVRARSTSAPEGRLRAMSPSVSGETAVANASAGAGAGPDQEEYQMPSYVDLSGALLEKLRKKEHSLMSQLDALSKLLAQTELMGEAKREQRLVEKSIELVKRELDTIALQKDQAEEYVLAPGKTLLSVPATSLKTDSEGKQYAVFRVRVELKSQREEKSSQSVVWSCWRRYSEFDILHSALMTLRAPGSHALDQLFPAKRLVALSTSASFIEGRRKALERYLEEVVTSPKACESLTLRCFLTPGASLSSSSNGAASASLFSPARLFLPGQAVVRDLVRNVDDLLFGSGRPLVDVLTERLSGNATASAPGGAGSAASSGVSGSSASSSSRSTAAADQTQIINDLATQGLSVTLAEASEAAAAAAATGGATAGINPVAARAQHSPAARSGSGKARDAGKAGTPVPASAAPATATGSSTTNLTLTAPLVDLMVELLELKEDPWRRTAIVVVVQQILGGTIDRQLRARIAGATSHDAMQRVLNGLTDALWPGGGPFRGGGGSAGGGSAPGPTTGEKQPAPQPPPQPQPQRSAAAAAALRERARLKLDVLLLASQPASSSSSSSTATSSSAPSSSASTAIHLAASLLGREKARRAARRLFAAVARGRSQRRLNKSLVYEVLDLVVDEVLGEGNGNHKDSEKGKGKGTDNEKAKGKGKVKGRKQGGGGLTT